MRRCLPCVRLRRGFWRWTTISMCRWACVCSRPRAPCFYPQAMRRAGMVRTLRALLTSGGPRGRMYAAGALTVLGDEAVLTAVHNTGSVLLLTKHYVELTEFDFEAKNSIARVRGRALEGRW